MLKLSGIEFTKNDKIIGLCLPLEITEDLAYICGVMAGDGSIYVRRDKCDYNITCVGNPKDEKDFYDIVLTNLFCKLFNKRIRTKFIKKRISYGFTLSSKTLVLFFTTVIGLPDKRKDNIDVPAVFLKDRNITKSFIQGLFDTDGSISLKRRYRNYHYYPVVSISSKSKVIIDQISDFIR